VTDDPLAHLIPPLRELMYRREERDRLKQEKADAENAYREQETLVHRLLSTLGKRTKIGPIDLGAPYGEVSFQRRETPYGKVYDQEAAVKAAEEQGLFEQLTLPRSNVKWREKALNDFVKECRETGQKLPPGIELVLRKGVTISRK
jgi:hypothetical protein